MASTLSNIFYIYAIALWTASWPAMLLKCYAPAAHPLKLMHWLTGATDSQTGS